MRTDVQVQEPISIVGFPNLAALPKKQRVCAYARVSTDKEDQANSYESQVRYFTEYIQKNKGWKFSGIYADGPVKIGLNQKRTHNKGSLV